MLIELRASASRILPRIEITHIPISTHIETAKGFIKTDSIEHEKMYLQNSINK